MIVIKDSLPVRRRLSDWNPKPGDTFNSGDNILLVIGDGRAISLKYTYTMPSELDRFTSLYEKVDLEVLVKK
jgi:hypothetical protein